MSIDERQRAIATRFPTWTPKTLHGAFDDAVTTWPNRDFLVTDARTWTYAEMADWSRRIAAGLVALGVRPGENVAMILANHPEFVALKLAIARVGAVAVPINILNRRDELFYLLEQSDAVLLVTMDRFRDNDYLRALDDIAPGWERQGGGGTLPKLRSIVVFGTVSQASHATAINFDELDRDDADGADCKLPVVEAEATCDIVYTSGTTGSPKGVLLTHDMLTRTAFGSAWARAFEDGRRIVFSLPMYHVFGYVEGLLAVPFVGGAIIPRLRFDAIDTLRSIERHRASDALLIPTMTLAVLDAAREDAYDLSSWHSALASGGRAPERLWSSLRDELGVEEITTGYGMTETTASTTVTRPDDHFERLLTTNGRQRDVGVAGDPASRQRLVTYRVIDPSTGAVLPCGEAGELVAQGMGVTRGYYKKPRETAAAFTQDGWLRTGDLGRIDSDGYITLLGRTKESYRCGGELVLPSEIEDLLTSNAEVEQAHVVPIPDERMGEVGAAFIVVRQDAVVDAQALQRFVMERLARFKVPRHFWIVDAATIPVTASGRARKFLLVEQARSLLEEAR
ncbi:AMP-binding protein [Sphingomonas citricola]|uniref:AMP-binding protein n=1 Tax=Sphingomonas citricola TaxID=2862498 RepID=UPI001CA51D6C|nr:AMP-binding protein [Sphingomonas citricola]